ncbi:hypothetical protein Hanom_Chr16g01501321 [Helianthus anomalus]
MAGETYVFQSTSPFEQKILTKHTIASTLLEPYRQLVHISSFKREETMTK